MRFVQVLTSSALIWCVSGCNDFVHFRFDGDEKKSCAAWVKKWPVARCAKIDPKSGKQVKYKCRVTCNACPGVSEPAKKGIGGSCSMDSQCHSQRCYAGVCSPSQPSKPSTPSPPASKKGNGQFCTMNSQCQSEYCLNNVCTKSNPSPSSPSTNTKKGNGQTCRWNYQCQSKNCLNSMCYPAGVSNPSPSPPSSPSSPSTNTKKGIGQSCRWNYQCMSRNCLNKVCASAGNSNPTPSWPSSPSTGTKKQVGQACQWNSECISNRCHDRICSISSNPNPSPSWPTPSWPSNPPPSPTMKSVGSQCTSNFECKSGYCSRGVCFQSQQCHVVDTSSFPSGTEFHENTIILVFVASGFAGQQHAFRRELQNAYKEMKKVEMFNDPGAQYQAFYVNKMHAPFCDYGCEEVDRLLCCDLQITRNLANHCFPASSKVQTIVIHNDSKYGGAGYASDNVAIISKNTVGARLAIHELGHSLFEFGDEYKYGQATSKTKANCDVKGCPKWIDLERHPTLGGGLCEVKSCKDGKFYSGRNSFMRNMYMPVGLVNLRFTCCTYLAYTKETPSYCDKFNFGIGLARYCMNDYQGYGGSAVYTRRRLRSRNIVSSDAKHHEIDNDHVSLSLNLDSKDYEISAEHAIKSPTLFRKHHLLGEYNDFSEVASEGFSSAHHVRVMYESGHSQEFIFADAMPVVVPPLDPYGNATSSEADDYSHVVFTPRKHLEIIVDKSKGKIANVTMDQVHL